MYTNCEVVPQHGNVLHQYKLNDAVPFFFFLTHINCISVFISLGKGNTV